MVNFLETEATRDSILVARVVSSLVLSLVHHAGGTMQSDACCGRRMVAPNLFVLAPSPLGKLCTPPKT